MKPRAVVIIGSGPAGLTAAIYAARSGLKPLLFEGEAVANNDLPGGQLMTTTEVDNYPGFPGGVTGPDLIANLRAQAIRFGTEIISRRVTELDLERRPFMARTEDAEYLAECVIVSTGAKSRMLDLPGVWDWLNRGLSTCATCDGFFFKDQAVVVIGGGDSALEEAIFLSRLARTVTVVVRSDKLRASHAMIERAQSIENIQWRWESRVSGLAGVDRLSSIELTHSDQSIENLEATGLFVAIGHLPSSELVSEQLELDEAGYIITAAGSRATSIPGVFACGDVQDAHYRQAITSAASGCEAALDATHWLEARLSR